MKRRSLDQKKAAFPSCKKQFCYLANGVTAILAFPFQSSIVIRTSDKVEVFVSFFTSNFNLDYKGIDPSSYCLIIPTIDIVSDIHLRIQIIFKLIKNLKIDSASGSDNIPTIVKKCAPELVPILSKIFKISYTSDTFPESCKIARIQPIKKDRIFQCHQIPAHFIHFCSF